ncbi:TadE/TadG family type IV pilus assembly protein [Devosia sp. FKR38]|uniref:TadE/TadG family type IV pilus assembly protein n=1 Tax=Devosia sp. FKR38 TaxID=2562312 RepID=UPI001484F0B9|nr:TadE/TadG family type IV pilus assembly protein [Devosia sp. FKR38]
MTPVSDLVSRFGRDERGVFAVMFAVMAIVLIALAGSVVDYVTLEQTRNRAQIALDAAALALQPEIFETNYTKEQLRAKAELLMQDRIGTAFNVTSAVTGIDINVADGTLYLKATMTYPTIVVRLVGVPEMTATIESEATRKKLALEVAFVLDNSGSMSYTGAGANGTRQRIQFLKDAANCATNTLFYDKVVDNPSNPDTCIPASGAKLVPNVRAAVVPFTMYVNVGSGNANASWMDKTGSSIIANDNFDTDDDESTLPTSLPNRFALFSATGVQWRGCVEARPHIKTGSTANQYLDTDDVDPTSGNALYVPLFSPDLVDGVGGNSYLGDAPAVCDRPAQGNTTCTIVEQRTCYWWGCGGSWSTSAPTGPTNFSNNTYYSGAFYGAHSDSCSCRNGISWTGWSSGTYQTRTGSCSGGGYIPYGLSQRELQERICKYHQSAPDDFSWGPNADCTRTAILPLTTSPSTVINTINAMTAEGGTNIHQGAVWGFNALSPTAPFTEGAVYNSATSKVMILMTDGENTAYNLSSHCGDSQRNLDGNCYNSAYGFPYNSKNTNSASSSGGNIERLGYLGAPNSTLVTDMNTRTSQTCENAKAAGITVYTIGLATNQAQQSTQQVVETMLKNCASTQDRAYFPQTPGELRDVFAAIANDLSALRLAR